MSHKLRILREKNKKKEHEDIVESVFNEPSIIKIDGRGIEASDIIYKKKGFSCEGYKPDILFLLYKEKIYEFMVVEVKSSGYGKSIKIGDKKMKKAWKYFTSNWMDVLYNIEKGKERLKEYYEVWIDLLEVYRNPEDMISTGRPWWFRGKEQLAYRKIGSSGTRNRLIAYKEYMQQADRYVR